MRRQVFHMLRTVYDQTELPTIRPEWRENEPPLNQTREQTREDIRVIILYPVSMESLSIITNAMNSTAEISEPTCHYVEDLIAEYKTLKVNYDKILAGGTDGRPWEGPAPLKKADVLEWDTSLLADGGSWIHMQTQGLTSRMYSIRQEILRALNLLPWPGSDLSGSGIGRLYRS